MRAARGVDRPGAGGGDGDQGDAPAYGYEAYVDKELGTAGPRIVNGADRRGAVFSRGSFAGMNLGEAQEGLRTEYGRMPDQQRQGFEARANMEDVRSPREMSPATSYRGYAGPPTPSPFGPDSQRRPLPPPAAPRTGGFTGPTGQFDTAGNQLADNEGAPVPGAAQAPATAPDNTGVAPKPGFSVPLASAMVQPNGGQPAMPMQGVDPGTINGQPAATSIAQSRRGFAAPIKPAAAPARKPAPAVAGAF